MAGNTFSVIIFLFEQANSNKINGKNLLAEGLLVQLGILYPVIGNMSINIEK